MNLFHLKIASPDGNAFEGEALGLYVRGAEGELAVLAGHIPFVTSIKEGECRVQMPDGEWKSGTISGGLLTVTDEAVTLLSSGFRW